MNAQNDAVMNLRKIRETHSKDDGGAWDEWPYPTITIESEVSGALRTAVLSAFGRAGEKVILIESEVSAGWSEFTQETEYGIAVQVDGETVWQQDYATSAESAMASFLRTFASGESQE